MKRRILKGDSKARSGPSAGARMEHPRGEDSQPVATSGALDGSADRTPVSSSLRNRLLRLAYRFVWNRDDAEDVVQDTLFVAFKEEHQLHDPQKSWPWLCRILVRRCHEKGRRKQRESARDERFKTELSFRQEDDTGTEAYRKDLVRRMIAQLPKRQQEVLVLRHLQQMSFDEIGNVLDIAPATARVHAQAARESLRERLCGIDPGMFRSTDREEKPSP